MELKNIGLHFPVVAFLLSALFVSTNGFSEEVLLEAGLIKKKESGGYFDFFRDRVIFPIKNITD